VIETLDVISKPHEGPFKVDFAKAAQMKAAEPESFLDDAKDWGTGSVLAW